MLDRPVNDYSDCHSDMDLDDISYESIKGKYEKMLETPANKPSVQYLLCPVGLIGTGKSTVIGLLSKRLNLLRVSSDEIRELLYNSGYNMKRLTELVTAVIDNCLSRGYSVAIDSDCVNATNICASHEKKYHLKLVWVHVNPPEEFIINNLHNYKRTWLFKDSDAAVKSYRYRKKLHSNLDKFDFVYTFDPSAGNLEEQLSEATKKIYSKIRS